MKKKANKSQKKFMVCKTVLTCIYIFSNLNRLTLYVVLYLGLFLHLLDFTACRIKWRRMHGGFMNKMMRTPNSVCTLMNDIAWIIFICLFSAGWIIFNNCLTKDAVISCTKVKPLIFLLLWTEVMKMFSLLTNCLNERVWKKIWPKLKCFTTVTETAPLKCWNVIE